MKKFIVLTIALFLVLGMTVNTSAKSYEKLPVMTAKAYSMGGAFTGVADDVGAVLFNPAGLTQSGIVGFQGNGGVSDIKMSELREVMDFANKISGDISFEDAAKLEESFPANISANLQGFAGANLKTVALSGNISSRYDIYEESGDKVLENNNDVSAIISYGAKLASPPIEVASLAYGFNIKMTQHNYTEYRLLENGDLSEITGKGNSIDLDFGVLAKVTDIFKVGAQIDNIYSSGYDLTGNEIISTYDPVAEEWTEEEKDVYEENGKKVKRNMRVGASLEIPVVGTTLAADLENIGPISESDKMIYHLGVQQNLFLNLISVRVGTYGPEINGEDSTYTAGIGVNLTKLHLDASVGTDKEGENMSGMISGRFKF